jgi:hypothetical protein
MLILGYVFAIRPERALCREVQVNLAYRWFCGLGLEDKVPDHSAFTRARNERFRDGDILRRVFERVVGTCIDAGFVGGDGFATSSHTANAELTFKLDHWMGADQVCPRRTALSLAGGSLPGETATIGRCPTSAQYFSIHAT